MNQRGTIKACKLINYLKKKIDDRNLKDIIFLNFERIYYPKIQQSCYPGTAIPATRSMILQPSKGIVSQGSRIYAQNSASFPCVKLSQPVKMVIKVNKIKLKDT